MSCTLTISNHKWPDYEIPVALCIANGSTVLNTILLNAKKEVSEIVVDRDLATKYPEVEMSCKALCPRAIITIRDDVTIPNKLLYNNNDWSLASPNDLYEYNLLQEHC
tara:strand:- start:47 stop:370 length:324 start_codon:yes stop_codon:yes gene_type:complete